MKEIDVSKCEKCPFYDEFGAICNMYSCHETNYSITEWQDKCLYKQLQYLKQENKALQKSYDFICKQLSYQADLKDKSKQKLEKIKEYFKNKYCKKFIGVEISCSTCPDKNMCAGAGVSKIIESEE